MNVQKKTVYTAEDLKWDIPKGCHFKLLAILTTHN